MIAAFLVLCLCVIHSIWSLQMKTSVRALTMFMTKLLLVLSVKFSRSNVINNFLWPLHFSVNLIVLSVENIIRIHCLYRHALLFEDMDGEFNIPLAANAKSVREFDEGLTRGRCFFHMKGIFSVFVHCG